MKKMLAIVLILFFTLTVSHVSANHQQFGYVRVLHASTDAPHIDIYINKEHAFGEIGFKSITDYKTLKDGSYKIKIFPEGSDPNKEKPIIKDKVKINNGEAFTLAVVQIDGNYELNTFQDNIIPTKEISKMRFVNLSEDTSPLELQTDEWNIEDVPFNNASEYQEVAPASQDLIIKTKSEEVIYEIPNLQLMSGANYTVFALGLTKGEPGFGVIITKDKIKNN
ncbi:DUF4397 domain-containing protein [Evansella sp. AB-rgal1]|uniref:DUF4397 domain-containing protein n=1 Tax=Evansella sp. AB-rgal1 TaxID=3242696 RepID=UPI00359D9A07